MLNKGSDDFLFYLGSSYLWTGHTGGLLHIVWTEHFHSTEQQSSFKDRIYTLIQKIGNKNPKQSYFI